MLFSVPQWLTFNLFLWLVSIFKRTKPKKGTDLFLVKKQSGTKFLGFLSCCWRVHFFRVHFFCSFRFAGVLFSNDSVLLEQSGFDSSGRMSNCKVSLPAAASQDFSLQLFLSLGCLDSAFILLFIPFWDPHEMFLQGLENITKWYIFLRLVSSLVTPDVTSVALSSQRIKEFLEDLSRNRPSISYTVKR